MLCHTLHPNPWPDCFRGRQASSQRPRARLKGQGGASQGPWALTLPKTVRHQTMRTPKSVRPLQSPWFCSVHSLNQQLGVVSIQVRKKAVLKKGPDQYPVNGLVAADDEARQHLFARMHYTGRNRLRCAWHQGCKMLRGWLAERRMSEVQGLERWSRWALAKGCYSRFEVYGRYHVAKQVGVTLRT